MIRESFVWICIWKGAVIDEHDCKRKLVRGAGSKAGNSALGVRTRLYPLDFPILIVVRQ